MKNKAYIFFSTGDPLKRRHRPSSIVRAIRVWKRRPSHARFWFLSWCIRTATRSQLAHVSIGDGAAVLDIGFDHVRYWPFDEYLSRYPSIVGFFTVPTTARPLLLKYETADAKRAGPVFLWWLSCGRMKQPKSCVWVVSDCLRRAGVAVPTITTPQAMYAWLASEGYTFDATDPDWTTPSPTARRLPTRGDQARHRSSQDEDRATDDPQGDQFGGGDCPTQLRHREMVGIDGFGRRAQEHYEGGFQ